jgi:hypothetical protein
VVFLKERFVGEHCKMVRMQTIWRRLKAGTYYPNMNSLQFDFVRLFDVALKLCCSYLTHITLYVQECKQDNVPQHFNPSSSTVTFRFGNILTLLTDMLRDKDLVNPEDDDCFVVSATHRVNDKNEKLYLDLQVCGSCVWGVFMCSSSPNPPPLCRVQSMVL